MADNRNDLLKLLKDLETAGKLTDQQARLLKKLKNEARDAKKQAEDTGESFRDMQRGLNDIGENFGLRLGEVFEQIEVEVEQASRDIASMFDDLQTNAPQIAAEIAEEFNSSFRNALPDADDIQAKINLNDLISQFKAQFPEMGVEMQKAFKTGDIATFYKKFGDEGMQNLQRFMKDKKGFGGLKEWMKPGGEGEQSAVNFRKRLEEFEPAAQKTTKVVANWGNLFRQIGDNILNFINIRGIIDHILEFDNRLSNIKREFNIPVQSFGKADSALQAMNKKAGQFGLTMEQGFEMVKKLGDEARSNNVQFLAQTASALAAIPQATGMASETVSELAGKMMFFGANTDQTKKAFASIVNSSNRFGLNITKVGKTFNDVFPRYARMGFKGGEESLAKMVARAEKLGMDIGKTLDMSEKFLDLNTAIEASADLSLLGGAASQVSFVDLMRAAEEGGDALIDLTERMTSDIGKIGPDGLVKLTGMERRRLKGIAEATGQDLEQLTNQLTSKLQDKAKQAAVPPGVFNGLSDEEKDFLLSKMVNKGGKWKFEGLNGITDLKNVSKGSIQAQMNAGKIEKENFEKRAQQTQSFQEAMQALVREIRDEMLKFRSVLDKLKEVFYKLRDGLDRFEKWVGETFGDKAKFWAKPIAILGTILLLTFPKILFSFLSMLGSVLAAPFKLLGKMGGGGAGGGGGIMGKLFGGKSKTEAPTTTPSTGGGQPDVSSQGGKLEGQKNIFARIIDGIKNILKSGIDLIRTLITGIGKIITDAIKVIGSVGKKLIGAVEDILTSVVKLIKNVGGQVIDGLSSLIQKLSNLISTSGTSLVNSISKLIGSIINLITTQGTALINGLSTVLGAAIKLINTQGVALANALGNVGQSISKNFFKIVNEVIKGLSHASSSLPTILGNAGKAVGAFFAGMTTGLTTFAQAMAAPTLLFGLPVGLIVLAMAMGLALAARIAAPAISAIGTMFEGLGKGLGAAAPAIEKMAGAIGAVFKGIAGIIAEYGKVIVNIIKELANSIIRMANIPFTNLLGVAGGITAVAYALAAFGGGSALQGIGTAIGEFFGGDPVKKLSAFASLNASNLLNVGNGIKVLATSLKSLIGVKIGDFADEVEKLGDLSSGPLRQLKDFSSLSGSIQKSINTLIIVAKSLQTIPVIDLSKITQLSTVINLIATNIKDGLSKLSGGAINSQLAKITASALADITKSLLEVKEIKTAAFVSLAKVLVDFIPGIKNGIGTLSSGVLNFQLAKSSASGLASIAKSLSSVPNVKIEPFISLAKIMNNSMDAIKNGLSKLSGLAIDSQLAKIAANGLASVAKNLSTIPNIKTEPLTNLAKILSTTIDNIKIGIEKLKSLTISAQIGRVAVSGIASIAKSLSTVPLINSKALEILSKILDAYIPAIQKGINLIGGGGAALNANIAVLTAKAIAKIAQAFNEIPLVKNAPFDNLNKILTNNITGISNGIKTMGMSLVVSAGIAAMTAKSIAKVARNLASVTILKTAPFEILAKILGDYVPDIKKGLSLLGGTAVASALVARGTVSSIVKISKTLAQVGNVKIAPFENLSRIFSQYIPLIKTGISNLGVGSAVKSFVAEKTIGNLIDVAKKMNSIPLVKISTFDSLATVLNVKIPIILEGLRKLSNVDSEVKTLSNTIKTFGNNLKNIGSTIENNAQFLLKGLSTFGKILPYTIMANAATSSLILITNSLQSIKPLNYQILQEVANTIFQISTKILLGMMSLGKANVYSLGAISSSKSLFNITQNLNQIQQLNGKTLNDTGLILSTSTPLMSRGIRILGTILPFTIPAVMTANKIVLISKILSKVVEVPGNNITQLANVLSQNSSKLMNSFVKFLVIRAFINPAIKASQGLVLVSKFIAQIEPINPNNLSQLANVIRTSSNGLITGLTKFAVVSLLVNKAVIAARGIVNLSKTINQIENVFFKELLQLRNVLLIISPGLISGILKFSGISFFTGRGNRAALGLVQLTKNINKIEEVGSKNLSSIGPVLSSTTGSIIKGLLKFAGISLFIGPAVTTSSGLKKLSANLAGVATLGAQPLLSLASVLTTSTGPIISALTSWGTILPLIGPATVVSYGIARIFKFLSIASATNIMGLTKQIPLLNSVVAPIYRFSMLGIVAPLLINAGIAISFLSKSLQVATIGFSMFSMVPWEVFTAALPTISALTSTLLNFGKQGLTASSGILAMSSSLINLGRSLEGVSAGFGNSTKSMADYNNEKERLRTITTSTKPQIKPQAALLENVQRSALNQAMGMEITNKTSREGLLTRTTENQPQVVQIKPIQINLKLNGRDLQKLLVEANYYRT